MRADLNWKPPGGGSVAEILNKIRANIRLRISVSTDQEADSSRLQRWRERHSRKQRFSAAARDSPSWLASMALHALAMVILGSLAGSQIRADRAPITLLMSSTDSQGEDAQLTSPFEVAPAPEQVEPVQEAQESGDMAEPREATPPEPTPVSNPTSEPEVVDDETDVQTSAEPEDNSLDDPFELERPTRPSLEPLVERRRDSRQNHASREQRHYDYVVNRFIEYDLGRLRGLAAQQANTNFRRLGPEAIPALVRGLNKSAYISASCPVGVISSKLVSAVNESGHDPEMLEYVLNHLGEDVPNAAPHYRRIQNVRQRLLGMSDKGDRRRDNIDEQRRREQQEKWAARLRQQRQREQQPTSRNRRREPTMRTSTQQRLNQTARQRQLDAQRLLRSALSMRRQGQLAASARLLRQVVSRYPNSQEAGTARRYLSGR